MLCACKVPQLCPVVFCVLGAVLKFYFRLVTIEHPTNRDRCKEGNAVIKTHVFFFNEPYISPSLHRRRECKGTLPKLCKSDALLVSEQT